MYAVSYKKNNINSICDAYLAKNITNKILRFTIPFSIIFIIEQIIYFLQNGQQYSRSVLDFIHLFLIGGTWSGSYYYPVMIQFVFVYPVIFFIIKKHDLKGVLIYGILNLVFEILKSAYFMNEECYRLLMFCYIFVISYGCYLAIGKVKVKNTWYLFSFITGFLYLIIVCYTKHNPIIIIFWTHTSLFSGLYVFPIISILFSKINLRCGLLEILGRALFDIFLVQKVYFTYIGLIPFSINNRFIQILVNISICITTGLVFYFIEVIAVKRILKSLYSILEWNY
jgi:hypothetical protein